MRVRMASPRGASIAAMMVFEVLTLAGRAGAQETVPVPRLEVMGEGQVRTPPDMAEVQIGVVTQGDTATSALDANNRAMQGLFGVLQQAGIAEKDIQTADLSVSPLYSQQRRAGDAPKIVGYQVSNRVQVRVRELERLGKVLDDAVGAGSNQIHGIQFSVAEPTSVLDEARKRAVADARRKAQQYAEAAGVKLGRVLLISEQGPVSIPPPRYFAAAERATVPIAPGEQEYRVQIHLTYELKP